MKKVVAILLIVLALTGCIKAKERNAGLYIPSTATLVQDLGNGWLIFELNGDDYLYHNATMGYGGYECVTKM